MNVKQYKDNMKKDIVCPCLGYTTTEKANDKHLTIISEEHGHLLTCEMANSDITEYMGRKIMTLTGHTQGWKMSSANAYSVQTVIISGEDRARVAHHTKEDDRRKHTLGISPFLIMFPSLLTPTPPLVTNIGLKL